MTMRSHLSSSQFNNPLLVSADQWYYINMVLLMDEISPEIKQYHNNLVNLVSCVNMRLEKVSMNKRCPCHAALSCVL